MIQLIKGNNIYKNSSELFSKLISSWRKNTSEKNLEKHINLQKFQLNSYCNNKVKRVNLATLVKNVML
jgi:hypothetical protein